MILVHFKGTTVILVHFKGTTVILVHFKGTTVILVHRILPINIPHPGDHLTSTQTNRMYVIKATQLILESHYHWHPSPIYLASHIFKTYIEYDFIYKRIHVI